MLKEHAEGQNKFWKDVKMLIPDMTNKRVGEILQPGSGKMCSGKEANDLMNEYFINIGKEMAIVSFIYQLLVSLRRQVFLKS